MDACETLQSRIVDSHDALDLGNVFNFAVTMAIRSPNRKVVKLALGMIAAFKPGEEVRAFVRTLGLSDEFTLFAAMAMQSWADPNAEWFDLAKRVTGWGRVHLVRMLRPETPEIRRWLLREGVHNDIMPQYSALDCWIKADVPAALAGPLSREDFSGIRDIIEALLDEGPVPGISGIEDAEAHLRTFLKRAESMALDDRDREVLSAVRDYLN